MTPEAIQRFADLVKCIRVGMGLNQRDFAELIGTSQASFQTWEAGKIKGEPRAKNLRAIAGLKGWTSEELMAYLNGKPIEPPVTIPNGTSNQALREILENLSQSQAREALKIVLPIAGIDYLDTTEKDASIVFFRGVDSMTFSQLLQRFLGATPPDIVDAQLTKKRLTRSRLNELIEGSQPTDEDIRKVGAILGDVGFKDSRGEEYSLGQLQKIAAGSSITNGASSR